MKNIALKKEERKNFILRYKVEGDKIYVYRPAGVDPEPLEYSTSNINYLNETMRTQIFNLENKKEHKEKSDWDPSLGNAFIFAVMGFGLMDLLCLGFSQIVINLILLAEAIILGGAVLGLAIYHKKHKAMVKDIEKHEEFLPVASEINEAVKTNSVVLSGINKFTAAAFIAAVKEYSGININTIDKCSVEDLRKIQKNIEIYMQANLTQSEEQASKNPIRVL